MRLSRGIFTLRTSNSFSAAGLCNSLYTVLCEFISAEAKLSPRTPPCAGAPNRRRMQQGTIWLLVVIRS